IRVGWSRGDWGANISGVRLGDFIQTSLTLADPLTNNPIYYVIPTMTTYNLAVNYRMDGWYDTSVRLQLGINNITDERAPLADDSFGYFADMHTDLGINYYLDVKLGF
ncbi:MAG: hypothetical protein WBN23_04985, partial [Woeseia sp.]